MQGFRQLARLSTGISRTTTGTRQLVDSFGRAHDYLRVSLTERCNLRCRYCMPAEGIELTQPDKCLSLLELERLTSIFVTRCGVRKIRLTGGEPTIDRKLTPFLNHLNGLRDSGLETIALTTNGLALRNRCDKYKNLGLNGVNISLDTLREDRFEFITRRKGLKRVLECIDEAVEVGLDKVKLNCVVMRGINDDELMNFVQLTRDRPVEVRFIEFMPFFGNKWSADLMVPYDEMLAHLIKGLPGIQKLAQAPNETAKLFKSPDCQGTIGFIASMTNNFCSGCNRLRLTADGNLKVCLFGRSETSLRDLMRNGASDSEIAQAIQRALFGKKKQHAGASVLQADVSRPMIKIAMRSMHSDSQDVAHFEKIKGEFTHLDSSGGSKMVNVGPKKPLRRVAVACGEIYVGHEVLARIRAKSMAKGDIISVSRIAGIMGAKMTSTLIPMCHQVPLDHVHICVEPNQTDGTLRVTAQVQTDHKTGVEMECLTAVSITLLTIYDMCKSVGKRDMSINDIKLVSKTKCEIS